MIYDDYEKDKDLKTGLASVSIQCDSSSNWDRLSIIHPLDWAVHFVEVACETLHYCY